MSTGCKYVKNKHGAVDYSKTCGLLQVADIRGSKLVVKNKNVHIFRFGKLFYLIKLAPSYNGCTIVFGALLNYLCNNLCPGGFCKFLKFVNGNFCVPFAAVCGDKYGALGLFFVFKHRVLLYQKREGRAPPVLPHII